MRKHTRRDFLDLSLKLAAATSAAALLPSPVFAADNLQVGILIPQSGPAGIFGPSSKNCAELGFEAINASGGIKGRKVVAVYVDAGVPPAEVAKEAFRLWKSEKIDVFIGMHDGAVREAVRNRFKGEVFYLHPPTYEGGLCDPGMIAFGETPSQLLSGSFKYLAQKRGVKKWYLIGNDYNWPHASNEAAKKFLSDADGAVVGEEYLPFTVDNFDASIAKIKESGADIVFITLVGGVSVNFNRAFASFGLDKGVVRVGTLIEENTLAGIGAENSHNLYSLGAYFEDIETPANVEFVKKYRAKFGPNAAVLNHLGEGVYEACLFMKAILEKSASTKLSDIRPHLNGLTYASPRGNNVYSNGNFTRDIYLMRAEGAAFKQEMVFRQVPSGEKCA
jgi:ABC-type branched-subunit amino acid transport system substrate-binding protein